MRKGKIMAKKWAKIRHPKLGVEREVAARSVKHWEKSGWQEVKSSSSTFTPNQTSGKDEK